MVYQQIYNPNSLNGLILRTMMQAVAGAAHARWSIDPIRGNPQVPWELTGTAQWDSFRLDLTNQAVRNLFYFGHGGAQLFGYGNSPGQRITVKDLNNMLGNARKPLVGTNSHPYRFVFLDGCKTASGGLPQAFGIPKGNVALTEFTSKRGIRPRAFVGWPNSFKFTFGAIDQGHTEFIGRFFQQWRETDPDTGTPRRLDRALTRATQDQFGATVYGKGLKVVIHGYHGLTFWEQ